MEVSNFITIILFVISCISIIISIITFVKNSNKDTSKDSYKWGQLDAKLSNLEKQVDKILSKLDTFEIEVDTKVQKAIENHEKQYHNHNN